MICIMIDVTCAIIRNAGDEILIVRRGEKTDHPLKWEFPGGKINKFESEEDCIIREIREELDIDIVICSRLTPVEYNYGNKEIRLIPFVCDTLDEMPILTEHKEYKWIDLKELRNIDFSEADIPVSQEYIELSEDSLCNASNMEGREEEERIGYPDLKDLITKMMGRQNAEWFADLAIENNSVFKKLLEYSISSDKKLAFKSSWALTKVCDRFPELIDPYLPDIISRINDFNNESVERSFLRIISMKDLNKIDNRFHGILADYSFAKLNSGFSAIAIKAYAMEILFNLSVIYPELTNELIPAIQILTEDGSAGVVARGRMILKKLNEN
jgi:8-oxo-dGTP diphosphatase